MNEMRVMRKALAASLIISAEATSVTTTGASIRSYNASTAAPSSSPKAPITIRSGLRKSLTARPSAKNSGFET
jgi:hypothetical protein